MFVTVSSLQAAGYSLRCSNWHRHRYSAGSKQCRSQGEQSDVYMCSPCLTSFPLPPPPSQRLGQSSLIGRFVPFVAIAAANCINIPLMRQRELQYGIPIFDEQDNRVGTSKVSI